MNAFYLSHDLQLSFLGNSLSTGQAESALIPVESMITAKKSSRPDPQHKKELIDEKVQESVLTEHEITSFAITIVIKMTGYKESNNQLC